MKSFFTFILVLILMSSCISEFLPQITEEKEMLVVQGLITDQKGANTIKLSKSMPLGVRSEARPLGGCLVKIKDDFGNEAWLKESSQGTYVTDSLKFRGKVGRFYTLHISVPEGNRMIKYESFPVEMKPVPPIDSLYYQKTVISEKTEKFDGIEGCQIYLDTHDPSNSCSYYRWEFSETWKLRLPFDIPNQTCYITNISKDISIESTLAFKEDRIDRHPVTYISNLTDRLKTKYSILVNQYSLNEDEYNYWKKLKNITVSVGGLHDIIPSSIPSNIVCIENPGEKVLGYFSVSAISQKRIFIKEKFTGMVDPYAKCATDTLYGGPDYIEGLGIYMDSF
ncbi:MAG: DUF4249 domain-containing protein [Bacteroidales bacterium]|nr:DUF4249 domain-containing protein [Bacteroidales bacterium]